MLDKMYVLAKKDVVAVNVPMGDSEIMVHMIWNNMSAVGYFSAEDSECENTAFTQPTLADLKQLKEGLDLIITFAEKCEKERENADNER